MKPVTSGWGEGYKEVAEGAGVERWAKGVLGRVFGAVPAGVKQVVRGGVWRGSSGGQERSWVRRGARGIHGGHGRGVGGSKGCRDI